MTPRKILAFTLSLIGSLWLLISEPAALHAQSKPPFKIRLATSTAGLDFAPIWIAQRKGFFKEEGVDFEHILTTGGAVTMAAIMNGDVQFVSTAASDVLVARARGDRMLAVGIFPASLEWHIATNNKWLDGRGLTKSQVAKMTVATNQKRGQATFIMVISIAL